MFTEKATILYIERIVLHMKATKTYIWGTHFFYK